MEKGSRRPSFDDISKAPHFFIVKKDRKVKEGLYLFHIADLWERRLEAGAIRLAKEMLISGLTGKSRTPSSIAADSRTRTMAFDVA